MSAPLTGTVSIVIPVYNAAKWLPGCLDSVLAQTWQDLEVLAVDDGSSDGSLAILEDYAARDGRIRLLRREHGGVSAARNAALREAAGEWLTFMDADDRLPPDAVSTLLALAAETGAEFCVAGHWVVYPDGRKRQVHVTPALLQDTAEAQRYFLTLGRSFNFPWGKLYHRRLYRTLEYPVGKIYEDIRVMPLLLEAAHGVAVADVPVYCYCQQPSSLTHRAEPEMYMQALEARRDAAEFVRLHHPELTPYLGDVLLDICLFVLGKARKGTRAQRRAVLEAVRAALEGTRPRQFPYRCAYLLFRLSPGLTGLLCDWYSAWKNRM